MYPGRGGEGGGATHAPDAGDWSQAGWVTAHTFLKEKERQGRSVDMKPRSVTYVVYIIMSSHSLTFSLLNQVLTNIPSRHIHFLLVSHGKMCSLRGV